MSNYKTNKNITMIDDLPFLDDLENNTRNNNGLMMIPSDTSSKVQKFIRNTNTHNAPYESGMNMNQSQPPPQQFVSQQQPPPQFMNEIIDDPRNYQQMQFEPEQYERKQQRRYNDFNEPTCIQVADHTMNCVVCSKLYQCNNTGYIVVIILLAIISVLLLKRVLNV
jgi:hypothetical protein